MDQQNQQPQGEEVSWWFKILARAVGTIGGLGKNKNLAMNASQIAPLQNRPRQYPPNIYRNRPTSGNHSDH